MPATSSSGGRTGMTTLVIYDITEDRIRTRVARYCLDYGLRRVQYSAFVGDLSRNRAEELRDKCARELGRKPGIVYLIPMPSTAIEAALVVGKEHLGKLEARWTSPSAI